MQWVLAVRFSQEFRQQPDKTTRVRHITSRKKLITWLQVKTHLKRLTNSSTTAVILLSLLTLSSGPRRSTKTLSFPSIQRTAINYTSYYRSREYCVYLIVKLFSCLLYAGELTLPLRNVSLIFTLIEKSILVFELMVLSGPELIFVYVALQQ